ncbi:C-5 cytosine-specific family DNA methylase [Enterococcus faecium]|uniref:DNA (cytosine-5-)-methyltransferase n=2 Tax=Enterococcus TaxID=1350 RepID=A0A2G0CUL2_ENTFC|nr:DNA (cytosine-5-)-methyltransferase [Enterococcus faecium]EME3529821.1 DNA (cytosine-5-)-methyltransferase [Enterococcus faecium]EME3529972.1 DNA (cytosine-5-)-methyltransferase [Enterococcus faecium]MBK4830847.1 C-5 cytosine-specific family DNA methylase [Enterococcus faecium]MBK4843740.1 C-5 cytosine-specific family DNA methylase [Enterococcus faecium]MBK4849374.1 C-5 cytosine-specific family DNA methylase [Enterococcus faecium]
MKFKVSYKPLWKLLIDREMKNSELRERAKISPSTFYKMKNNENVTTDTLMKICSTLECDISDIIECIEGEHNMNIKSDVVAVSLFSGAGGLDIASFMAGVPVISSTDFEKDCIETLRMNEDFFGETTIIPGDLHNLSSDIFKNVVREKAKNKKVIVIGGAPCQPFSKAGYWVGNQTRRGINDPRANLVNEYLRVVTDMLPDGFVFENVESLLHPTNKVIVERFIEIIEDAGYKYKIVRANALDYGVSQKRKRLFILGTKGEFKEDEPRKTHGDPKKIEGTALKPYVNVGEVIAGFEGKEYFEPYEVIEGGTYADDLKEVPAGMNYKALTAWAGYPNPKFVADKRFWNFLLKLSPNKPSWTITAQPGPWVGPFHWDNRRLRVPEVAAIQSFPKDYKFFGSRRSIQKQIGNAVPPLMGKAMVEFVKESVV